MLNSTVQHSNAKESTHATNGAKTKYEGDESNTIARFRYGVTDPSR